MLTVSITHPDTSRRVCHEDTFPGDKGVARLVGAHRGNDRGRIPCSATPANTVRLKGNTEALPKPHRLHTSE